MTRLSLLLLIALASPAHAQKPTVATTPLKVTGVPTAVGQTFDTALQQAVGAQATMADGSAAGVDGTCKADACGAKLAAAAKARFALTGTVVNSDEIYTVDLSLYDAATKKRTAATEVCELCGADDVQQTVTKAFAKLQGALSAPDPTAEVARPPPVQTTVALQVETEPDGATVSVDGKERGQSPIGLQIEPGRHEVLIVKTGFVQAKRTVSALDQTVKLTVKLEADPTAVAVVPPPVAPPLETPPPPPVEPASEGGGHAGLGWGFAVGGAILAGVGTWLTILDGEVTCTDGRGRRECPNVYNTKPIGLPALGVGAVLLGAGVTVLVLDPGEPEGPSAEARVEPTAGGAVLRFGGRF